MRSHCFADSAGSQPSRHEIQGDEVGAKTPTKKKDFKNNLGWWSEREREREREETIYAGASCNCSSVFYFVLQLAPSKPEICRPVMSRCSFLQAGVEEDSRTACSSRKETPVER